MRNIKEENIAFQANFAEEIRRSCRLAVDRFGGLRRFADARGEKESNWFNRLTPGRTVGFDVDWLNKVLETTGDYEVLMPFFRSRKIDRHGILTKIARKSGYYALLIEKFKVQEKRNHGDTTLSILNNLLMAGQRILEGRDICVRCQRKMR